MAGACWVPVPPASPFPLANLPLGVGRRRGAAPVAWVAIGDRALDLAEVQARGFLAGTGVPDGCFAAGRLNPFLALGPRTWREVRAALADLLTDAAAEAHLGPALHRRAGLTMDLPVEVGDFVDFYSSLHHATNLGRLFRPDGDPLLPNWRRLPVGYHGRAGTVVPDGALVPRPRGQRLVDGRPEFGPTERLDLELEVGTIVGVGSRRGEPIDIGHAGDHLYGMALVNDWSARDLQAFEYQPLGPFLGKSFATSLGPWVVSFEALAPFRRDPPAQDPPVAGYLRTAEPWAFDLTLEVLLETATMRRDGRAPERISCTSFAGMYWTPAQQLAHLTANGASVRPGDLLASGTVSGPEPGSEGSLIELTDGGRRPLRLAEGSERTFLLDGDRVILRGWAGVPGEGGLGLGEVSGTIVANQEPEVP